MKKIAIFFTGILQIVIAINTAYSQNNTAGEEIHPNCWRWEKMMPKDMQEALETIPVAYLVISPLEWHGEAMTFGTDPVIGSEIAEVAWRKTGGVLIPTIYLGSETEYKEFVPNQGLTTFWGMEVRTRERNPGSIYVSNHVVELVLLDMLRYIEREGFKACVIVSGHGAIEYSKIISEIENRYKDRPMRVFYSDLVEIEPPATDMNFPGSGGHADFAEASSLGAVDQTQVDKSLFGKSERDRSVDILHENADKIDYEKGRTRINFRAERIAETVHQFLNNIKKE